jgi:hypothetical protein
MAQEPQHPESLRNFERAYIPVGKIRHYAFRDPDKSRVFRALGYSEEAGNWEALRAAILDALPRHAAGFDKQDEYGITYEVTLTVSGPLGKEAPLKTYWIYEWGEDSPRLITLYVNAKEWRRWEQAREGGTEA